MEGEEGQGGGEVEEGVNGDDFSRSRESGGADLEVTYDITIFSPRGHHSCK